MPLFRKYSINSVIKILLFKIYNMEINLQGDYIRAIKMPLSFRHQLFN